MIKPMTDKQRALIAKLNDEAGTPEAAVAFFATEPTLRDASNRIGALLDAAKARKAADAAKVEVGYAARPVAPRPVAAPLVYPEPGYYAVSYENVLRFYRVKEGKGFYADRRFIDRFKSDELRNITPVERRNVLAEILLDPDKAGMRFAMELTRCRCCGRMLTDEISRLRGIGPDCAGRRAEKDEIGMALLGDAR